MTTPVPKFGRRDSCHVCPLMNRESITRTKGRKMPVTLQRQLSVKQTVHMRIQRGDVRLGAPAFSNAMSPRSKKKLLSRPLRSAIHSPDSVCKGCSAKTIVMTKAKPDSIRILDSHTDTKQMFARW